MQMFIGMKSLLTSAEAIENCLIETIDQSNKMIGLDDNRNYRWNAPHSIDAVIRFVDQFDENQEFVAFIKLNAFTSKDGKQVEFLNIIGLQTQSDYENNGIPTVSAPVQKPRSEFVWRKKDVKQTGDATPAENHGETDPHGNPNTAPAAGVVVKGQ